MTSRKDKYKRKVQKRKKNFQWHDLINYYCRSFSKMYDWQINLYIFRNDRQNQFGEVIFNNKKFKAYIGLGYIEGKQKIWFDESQFVIKNFMQLKKIG